LLSNTILKKKTGNVEEIDVASKKGLNKRNLSSYSIAQGTSSGKKLHNMDKAESPHAKTTQTQTKSNSTILIESRTFAPSASNPSLNLSTEPSQVVSISSQDATTEVTGQNPGDGFSINDMLKFSYKKIFPQREFIIKEKKNRTRR
jgi:hypothetical protein